MNALAVSIGVGLSEGGKNDKPAFTTVVASVRISDSAPIIAEIFSKPFASSFAVNREYTERMTSYEIGARRKPSAEPTPAYRRLWPQFIWQYANGISHLSWLQQISHIRWNDDGIESELVRQLTGVDRRAATEYNQFMRL